MRGHTIDGSDLFHTFNLEDMVPAAHPLRLIKQRADAILRSMSRQFNESYGHTGRPSVPPERLIKAMLLQALYSIRSERQLCEQIQYNMLFRWFCDMSPSEAVWTPEAFSVNRERFDVYGLPRAFFDRVVREAALEGLVSEEHFSVDGTLIQSWASQKSLRPIGTKDQKVSDSSDDDDPGNPTVNFHNEKRSNATHRSLTDPEARLARKGKGKPAILSHSGHVLMEHRSGLCVDIRVDAADGQAERRQAMQMIRHARRRQNLAVTTLGADAGYDDGNFLGALEESNITPHVAIREGNIVAEDAAGQARRRARRRMETIAYAISQRIRKRAEEIIGWCKTIGGLVRARFVGQWKIQMQCEFTGAAYNLLRMSRLLATTS
jgi:transposase